MAVETRELITIPGYTGGQLAVYEEPDAIIARYTKQADALMKVVKAKNLARKFGDKEYLEAPAWQVIAAFNNAHPVPRPIERILDKDGETVGYSATVDLLNQGEIVSSGTMTCYLSEYPCQGKKGDDKHRAAISAAQTWALSKAAKMKFAWVAVLAGYAPTPAEEMSGEETKQSADNPNWCREHKTVWFKKGKMTGFGHPIEGTEPKEWCHMPSQPKPAPRQVDTATGEVTEPPDDSHPLAQTTPATTTIATTNPTTLGVTPPSPTSTPSSNIPTSADYSDAPPAAADWWVQYDYWYPQAQQAGWPLADIPRDAHVSRVKAAVLGAQDFLKKHKKERTQ